jgi:tetratricopeptide (TPR) repeat protein
MLFPDGVDHLPRLAQPVDRGLALNGLALAYKLSGQPARSAPLYRRAAAIASQTNRNDNLAVGLSNLSGVLRTSGQLRASESAARRALTLMREETNRWQEAIILRWFGETLAARGDAGNSALSLDRSLRIFTSIDEYDGFTLSDLAQRAVWFGEYTAAGHLANRAWNSATQYGSFERAFILAARLQGETALALNDFAKADERLHHALTRARAVNHVEEEIPTLIALAELRRRQGDRKAARELLDDLWDPAERGPYPLLHSDAFNVMAQIERDEGNHTAASEAATKAYRLAWCDGPPFAYHWGLVAAQKHLQELGAPEPVMPPFDESKCEPMPEVEIDPQDEFHENSPQEAGSK